MKPYHQITAEERYALMALQVQGLRPAAIARALGRHRSSITRELRRNARTAFGHWEADTMLGDSQAGPCTMTMVERKSRFVAIGKLERRTTRELNHRAQRLITAQPRPVHTITADNGTEFPAQRPQHRAPHPARLEPHRGRPEPPATQAARLQNPGGMLCPLTMPVALQT